MFKQIFKGKEAVVFDLDGTLVDSKPLWNAACTEVAQNLGFEWRGSAFLGGQGLRSTWNEYLRYADINPGVSISELVKQTKDKFLKRLASADLELLDGFWHFMLMLKDERNFKLGLVTNTDKDVGQKVLQELGVSNVFDIALFGDDVKKKKPNPEIYKLACKKLGIKPHKILVFEDSPEGVKAAVKAKMPVIAIWNPSSPPKKEYSTNVLLFVEDFSVFPGNLDKTYKESLLQETSEEIRGSVETEEKTSAEELK